MATSGVLYLTVDTTALIRGLDAARVAIHHWAWELRWQLLTGEPWA